MSREVRFARREGQPFNICTPGRLKTSSDDVTSHGDRYLIRYLIEVSDTSPVPISVRDARTIINMGNRMTPILQLTVLKGCTALRLVLSWGGKLNARTRLYLLESGDRSDRGVYKDGDRRARSLFVACITRSMSSCFLDQFPLLCL